MFKRIFDKILCDLAEIKKLILDKDCCCDKVVEPELKFGSISGIVTDSKSGRGMSNVRIELIQDGNIVVIDGEEQFRITNIYGKYLFENIPIGDYQIKQIVTPYFKLVEDKDISDDGDLVANVDHFDNLIPVTLTDDELDADNQFYDTHTVLGAIRGKVQNVAREYFEGIKILLYQDDAFLNAAYTDANGYYTFNGYPFGEYELRIDLDNTDYELVLDNDVSDDGDNIANLITDDGKIPVTLTEGEIDDDNIFTIKLKSSTDNLSSSFAEIIGIVYLLENENENGEAPSDQLQLLGSVFNNMRTYNLIDHSTRVDGELQIFNASHKFSDNIPVGCGDCGTNCWPLNNGANLAAYKTRWCKWDGLFTFNTFSPQVFLIKNDDGSIVPRGYPDYFFSPEELGEPYQAGYLYAKVLASTLSDQVQCFEIGNEPHGEPGVFAWQEWSKGFVTGIREVAPNALISTADIQNSGTETYNGNDINTKISDVPPEVMAEVDYLKIHQYNFKNDPNKWPPIVCSNPPEVQTMAEYQSLEQQMADMAPYRGSHKLMVGEYGYDHEVLGEEKQAAFIFRAIILGMYNGFDKMMYYAAADDPAAGDPFDTIGLIDADGNKLMSFFMLQDLILNKGDFRVVERLTDSNFEYSFKLQDSNGTNYITSWNVVDTTIPQIIEI